MRYLYLTIIVIIVGVVILSGAVRMPVGELFTATDCGPCASAAAYIDANFPGIQPISIIVRYEVDGPFPAYDPTGTNGRVSQYFSGTYGVPNMHIDGTDYSSGPYATWFSTLESRALLIAPLDISFTELTGDSVEITLTLENAGFNGTYKLFAMIIEDTIYYSAPNGQTVFHQVFRSMITASSYGDNVTLSALAKAPVVKNYALDIHEDWDMLHCYVVAFVQNTSTDEFLQGARIQLVQPDYMFNVLPIQQTMGSISEDTTVTMNATVSNNGANNDTYDIYADLLLPTGWTVTTYAGGTPFTTHTTLFILSDGNDAISTTINSNGISGSGTVRFRVSSPNIPGQVDTVLMTLNAGANIVLVDDDDGGSFETWFQSCLNRIGAHFSNYDHDGSGAPSGAYLSQFDVVIWMTGNDYSDCLSSADITALQTYLSGGGKLYFSSTELGYYTYDGGSGSHVQSFYENYLKATYSGDDAGTGSINGVTSDPIGNGLAFSIEGGDGADNQTWPDYISPRSGASTCLEYGSGTQHAGIKYDSGTFKIVYTGFGFEGVNSQSARDTLMYRILNWLDPSILDIEENNKNLPVSASISAYPNPFNSLCKISVQGVEDSRIQVVEIFGLNGKLVGRMDVPITDKRSTDNEYIWRPDETIASGVFLVRVVLQEQKIVRRIIYIK